MARITETELLEAAAELTFGIEIETAYVEPSDLGRRMVSHLTAAGYTASTIGTYSAKLVVNGKTFELKHDGSIRPYGTEIVSPILRLSDMPLLQDVVRAARKSGAKAHESCGVHIHIGVGDWTVKQIINLAKIVNKQEDLMFAALGTSRARRNRWCRPVGADFINKISGRGAPRTREALADAWYGPDRYGSNAYYHNAHYHNSRYHGLNLHSVFYRGTAEFRYFNASLHAGEIKSWVQFVLAIAVRARRCRAASATRRVLDSARVVYDVRVFCLDLGLSGDTFKTARRFLFGDKSPIAGRGSYSRRQRRTVRRAA